MYNLNKERLDAVISRWEKSLKKAKEDMEYLKNKKGNYYPTQIRVWYHEEFLKDLYSLRGEGNGATK